MPRRPRGRPAAPCRPAAGPAPAATPVTGTGTAAATGRATASTPSAAERARAAEVEDAQPRRPLGGRAANGRIGVVALAALCVVYVWLATLPAARGASLVRAPAGGSPGWVPGALRSHGTSGRHGA